MTRQGQWFVRAYVQGMLGSGETQRTTSGAKLIGAIGVMFTVAGQDDIRAVYPNISFKEFFEQN